MHDDALERQLRDALRSEADRLSFTITPAELERRAVLRGGRAGHRRLTLLLAAAIAIGGLAAGGLVGQLIDTRTPAPTAPVTARESTSPAPVSASPSVPASTPSSEPQLPSLDELIALDPGGVLVAQAHGPADGSFDDRPGIPRSRPASTSLGTVHGGTNYRISVACIGPGDLVLDARLPSSRGPISGPRIRCDGSLVEETVVIADAVAVSLSVEAPASWRIVVRGDPGRIPLPTDNPVLPPVASDLEELLRLDDHVLSSIERWGEAGMLVRGVGSLPYREAYGARLWCPPGSSVRLIFGTQTEPLPTAETETHLACDGTVHDVDFDASSLHSIPVYVAATPGTRFSLLLTSQAPPVATVRELPGWQVVTETEPELAQTSMRTSSGLPVDGGGPLRVVVDCAGTDSIEVNIDVAGAGAMATMPPGELEATDTFVARCSDEGTTTSHTFDAPRYQDVLVFYATEAGTWTALSIFIPEGAP